MQDFKKLNIWRKAHELTLAVYSTTRTFPSAEIYGLRAQMRRASSSIGINIAEGCGTTGPLELRRYLRVSMGSASELEYELLLARDLRLISETDHRRLTAQVVEIKRMTTALIRKLKTEN
ncbi:MAG TPA: four helix bundle protein [Thermoanaerobaculia bacterium]|nr:four helix bundle protein [Thermoanaerobaculia bacterium]